ncbi:MAG: hypothetical protein HZB57_09830 [Gammaproteobacteria bacterium]|nr:hypothetical protein [Gammaproteobacteria bacterium]
MRPMPILMLIFFSIPLIEIYLLIKVGPPQAGPPPAEGPVTLEGEFRREDDE